MCLRGGCLSCYLLMFWIYLATQNDIHTQNNIINNDYRINVKQSSCVSRVCFWLDRIRIRQPKYYLYQSHSYVICYTYARVFGFAFGPNIFMYNKTRGKEYKERSQENLFNISPHFYHSLVVSKYTT